MTLKRVLVAARERAWRVRVATFLHAEGFVVTEVADFDVALQVAQKDPYEIVLFDYDVLEGDPFNFLYQWHKANPDVPVILMAPAAFPYLPNAFQKSGVLDCLHKPLALSSIRAALHRLLTFSVAHRENEIKETRLPQQISMEKVEREERRGIIIGESQAMKQVLEMVDKVADSDSTILITGASGTGKELIARRIHRLSGRKDQPLVSVNCSALPETLLESELFGHEKGAFTGATEGRLGRFAKAHRGSIFLDEIGDLTQIVQVKLLRVIQEKEFEAVGSNTPKKIDVRIIAATHRNLEKAVADKRFREDLYYRLNVIPIHLPLLRERGEDIPLLVDHFIRQYNKREKRDISGISAEALKALRDYDWPGNIREIENLIERLVILKGSGEIQLNDLNPQICARGKAVEEARQSSLFSYDLPTEGFNLRETLLEVEKQILVQALERTRWNRNRASKLLGLKRTTLIEKMKRLGLDQNLSEESDIPEKEIPETGDLLEGVSTEGHA
ncbi:MAG: sigma-54-dependent Fis family transcriptional regulator [Deltaproteobacteria bacterium]|nr:sigma-54-dependent Fis family transcriptional regulator [Deltaproteobacteria bacterium]